MQKLSITIFIVTNLLLIALSTFGQREKDSIININAQNIDTSKSESSTNDIYPEKKCMSFDVRCNFSEKDLTKFNRWVIHTLEESKHENKSAIIIDKSAYTLYLIDSGRVHSRYAIESGFNPFDDKKRVGDGSTPEGEFYIAEKKAWSNYYKAILISYPSIEDAKRGVETKLINTAKYHQIVDAITNKETPDQYTRLGGLIEIHGEGSGKPGNNGGYNWTLGCIALSNNDIDKILPFVNKGDRITIVKYTKIDLSYIENK